MKPKDYQNKFYNIFVKYQKNNDFDTFSKEINDLVIQNDTFKEVLKALYNFGIRIYNISNYSFSRTIFEIVLKILKSQDYEKYKKLISFCYENLGSSYQSLDN